MKFWTVCMLTIGLAATSACSVRMASDSADATPKKTVGTKSTAATFKIPPGHLPAPGMCKIWLPGTPPGHQPKYSGSCDALAREVPPGAWLVYRPTKDKKHIRVTVYDDTDPGLVIRVRLFEIATGLLVEELDS